MLELENKEFKKLIPLVERADLNTLFVLSVLEGKVNGKVFVDDFNEPKSFYIRHPYGMSLLYGITERESFYESLKSYMLNEKEERENAEWMQVYPPALYTKIEELLQEHLIKMPENEIFKYSNEMDDRKTILEFQRINFSFPKENHRTLKELGMDHTHWIVTTTKEIYEKETGSVIPKYFWNTYEEFKENGGGFTLLVNQEIPSSTAFTSYRIGNKLEIGIETMEEFRGLGYATYVCIALIDYCMEHGYEPYWSCNSGNPRSKNLAEKLGFVEVRRVPYYRLPR